MNPRVSRSSALASKATGFPIAKIAAKLAVGYSLDEIPNDITRETPASFEPALDYVVVKVPRFAFEKFPQADPTLTTTMKSVGEAMAIGRNFTEALQKALRSLERADAVFGWGDEPLDKDALVAQAALPARRTAPRGAAGALRRRHGRRAARGHRHRPVVPRPDRAGQRGGGAGAAGAELAPDVLRTAKRHGFSDRQMAELRGTTETVVRGVRHALGHPSGLQDRRHLRRRVRRDDALPLLLLRRGDRGRSRARSRRC